MKKSLFVCLFFFATASIQAQCIGRDTICTPATVSHPDASLVSTCGSVFVFGGTVYAWGNGGGLVYNDGGTIYVYDAKIAPTSAGGWTDTVCTGTAIDENYVRTITGQLTNPAAYTVWLNGNNGTHDVWNFQLEYGGCLSPVYSFFILEEACSQMRGRRLIYIQGKNRLFYYDENGNLKELK